MQTGCPGHSSSHATHGSITVNTASRGAHEKIPSEYLQNTSIASLYLLTWFSSVTYARSS